MKAFICADLLKRLPNTRTDIRDTRLHGFLIRCRASGVHSYAVQLGRRRLFTLGRVDQLTHETAREQAQAVLNSPDDPIASRRAARAVPRYATFLSETYEPWARQHLRSADETIRRLTAAFQDFQARLLSEIEPFAVERWRTSRLKAGASPATVNRDLDALKAALSKAVQWGILPDNPIAKVRRSLVDRSAVIRFLSPDEESRLRTALWARDAARKDARDRNNEFRRERSMSIYPRFRVYTDHLTPLVLLALNTGLRRGELLQLAWRDVDYGGARLTIRGAGTKSGQSRFVSLNSEAISVLQDWEPARRTASTPIFKGVKSAPIHHARRSFETVLQMAGIRTFRFHDLRHTFASKLVQGGVPLNTVRELLGHSDMKMTQRYAHLAPEHHRAAVETLVRVG